MLTLLVSCATLLFSVVALPGKGVFTLLISSGTLVVTAVAELVNGQVLLELSHLLVATAPVLTVAGSEE